MGPKWAEKISQTSEFVTARVLGYPDTNTFHTQDIIDSADTLKGLEYILADFNKHTSPGFFAELLGTKV